MPSIEITVDPAGQSHVETQGFKGADCRLASQFLERALGEVVREQLTSEYHAVSLLQQTSESEQCLR